jgi:hypothetical protein
VATAVNFPKVPWCIAWAIATKIIEQGVIMIIQYIKPCRETLKQLKADLEQLKIDYKKHQMEIEQQIEFIKSGSPRELVDQ